MIKKLILISGLLLAFLLAGCSTPAETPTETVETEAVEVVTEMATIEAAASTDEPAATEEAAVTTATDECVACHTDKELLIAIADPIEEEEGESEGVG